MAASASASSAIGRSPIAVSKPPPSPRTFHLVNYGCPKNLVDGEGIAANLLAAGLQQAGPEDADLLIVNTCGFIGPAEEESTNALADFARDKHEGQRLIAAGCLSERRGAEIAHSIPGIDGVLGTRRCSEITTLVQSLSSTPHPALLGPSPAVPDSNERIVAGPSAYVKIADGCNKNCSFCTIPSFKGRQISKTPEAILSELDTLAGRGVREAVLIAQELGSYGVDLPSVDLDLIGLLHAIQEAPGPDWIRLMYLYPSMLTSRLLDAMAASPRICNYIDVPIQHSVPAVLRRMRRPTGSADIADRIQKARQHHPDFAFRTTLIVGFPGETDDDFTDLCEFVEYGAFDHLGVFTYSPEDGTPAASLPNQVDPAIRNRRYAAIMEIQQGVALSRRLARVGAEIEVLVEETLPGPTLAGHQSIGRGRAEAPEVDGRVFLDLPLLPGQIVRARVSGAEPYDLFANVTAAPDGPLKLASEPAVTTEVPA